MKGVLLVIASLLAVAAAAAVAHASASQSRLAIAESSLGRILVDGSGRTVYLFEADRRGQSACTGACAAYWPPLVTRGRATAVRGAKQSLVGVIHRKDGSLQVSYAGHPLYYYVDDRRPGQTLGQDSQEFGAGWYVLSAGGAKVERGR